VKQSVFVFFFNVIFVALRARVTYRSFIKFIPGIMTVGALHTNCRVITLRL